MKIKTIFTIIVLLTLLVLPGVNAQPLPSCTNTPAVNQNCTFITPPIQCGNFTYSIINQSGIEVVTNDTLVVHNANHDLYEFNFSLTEKKADFQIVLCEGTFREVKVGGDPVSFEGGVSLLLVASMAVLGFFGFILNQIDVPIPESKRGFVKIINALLSSIKHLFMLSIIWLSTLGVGLSVQMAENAGASAGVINLLNTAYTILLWLSTLATIFLLIAAFIAFISKFLEFGDPRLYKRRG